MKKIIVGNWKMNPSTLAEARQIFSEIKKLSKKFPKIDIVVCPPFVYLSDLKNKIDKASSLKLGAQDVFWDNPETGSRPFTGEISASMLRDAGVKYVILGHSERRAMGETSEEVNKKIKIALEAGLTPVICIGEKEHDIDGKFFETLKIQIKDTLNKIKKADLQKIIMAYEPIWAIGKSESESMKGEDLYQMAIFIRKILSEMFGQVEAFKTPIVYGGSVSPFNVKDIISQGHVDGILAGRASLESEKIAEIMDILAQI